MIMYCSVGVGCQYGSVALRGAPTLKTGKQ